MGPECEEAEIWSKKVTSAESWPWGEFSGSVNIHILTRLPRDEGLQRSTSTALRREGQAENPADSAGYAEVCEEERSKTHGWSGRGGVQHFGNTGQQGERQVHRGGGPTVSQEGVSHGLASLMWGFLSDIPWTVIILWETYCGKGSEAERVEVLTYFMLGNDTRSASTIREKVKAGKVWEAI